jgi:hypothetical protein
MGPDFRIRLMLYGWPLVAILLFQRIREKHWAVIWTVLLGALFLPEVQMSSVSAEAPDPNSFMAYVIVKMTKPNAIAFSLLVAAFLLDTKRLFSFKPRWFDIPMLVWCIVPTFSDLLISPLEPKKPTVYDSLMASRDQVWFWGFAYYFGRVYFRDVDKLRDLALGFVYGGLIYTPICLYECRMFPSAHENLYGFFPGDKNEVFRWGGYRPVAFMTHGLATALFLAASALAAVWLWWTGTVKELKWWPTRPPVRMAWVAGLLAFVAVATRSTGAILMGGACLAALFQLRWVRQPFLVLALLLGTGVYLVGCVTFMYEDPAVMASKKENDPDKSEEVKDREASRWYRRFNENKLVKKIWNAPFFGYGDTGLSRKVDKLDKNDSDEAVTDSFWSITMSAYGFVGLIAVYLAMLLPVARYMYYYKPSRWDQPLYAVGAALAMILLLWMLDNLMNGFFSAMYVLTAGALSSVTGNLRPAPKAPPGPPAQAGMPVEPFREGKPFGTPPAAVGTRAGVLRRGRPMPK